MSSMRSFFLRGAGCVRVLFRHLLRGLFLARGIASRNRGMEAWDRGFESFLRPPAIRVPYVGVAWFLSCCDPMKDLADSFFRGMEPQEFVSCVYCDSLSELGLAKDVLDLFRQTRRSCPSG